MKTILELFCVLSEEEKKQAGRLLLVVGLMALLETAGVASVMPFLLLLGDAEAAERVRYLGQAKIVLSKYGIEGRNLFVAVIGAGSLAALTLAGAYRLFAQFKMNAYIENCRHGIANRILEAYIFQQYSYFLEARTSDMTKTILSEVDQLVGSALRPVLFMASYSIVLFFLCLLIFTISPTLALASAAILVVAYSIIYFSLRGILARLGDERAAANKKRFSAITEIFSSIKLIKFLGVEKRYLEMFGSASSAFSSKIALNQTITQIPNVVVELVLFALLIALTVFLTISVENVDGPDRAEILATLGLLGFSAYRIKPAAQRIYQGFASARYAREAISKISADIQLAKGSPKKNAELGQKNPRPLTIEKYVKLEKISFTHKGSREKVLSEVDLSIHAGMKVGIIGPTGSGKSTLVDIILGLLKPTNGEILLDGSPLLEGDIQRWQRSIGYVTQENYLIDGSIADNVAFGEDNSEIDFKRVWAALEIAQLKGFVEGRLRDGIWTSVGEKGIRLSGGQKQRLAIARALYRNCDILVLDEGTSSLDPVTEKLVMKGLSSRESGKTLIAVAHRISTLEDFDKILVLDNGKVVGLGSLAELEEDSFLRKYVSSNETAA